ncbi:D-alanine--D-alanine ligase [Dysgonomonas sp. 216]|uniref:D-alanine--D-alanine ligase n=1 Tax=Dysgonomonas sp. 216 TaxID=2302934 RepID=UPI0013D39FAE|nr:D-alanine--D-alanine ligase [Dysgonomonas sp. 216]NDW17468.1 D-alanine--D-alanine ligase [Dysgonomonas sp. 216]
MGKKNIAVVWGGYSSEIVVSEKSMQGIYSFIDKNKYNVYKVKIDHNGWFVDVDGEELSVDKNYFGFEIDNAKVNFDFAYITIHGTPGEDGKLQGYLDMLNIPYSACGVMAASLTMNKYVCNKYLKNFGVHVAESIILKPGDVYDINEIAETLKFPMFVKPNTGGSSFATFKVKKIEDLQTAIEEAFNETSEVIIESFIAGREVTCGCFKVGNQITVLPLTEVVTSNDFFDYNAKYNGQVEEITPARISDELTARIQQQTIKLYGLVEAKGIIRADYIIKDDIYYLLEVNTTPGMTVTSFIPQQIKAAGIDITSIFTDLIENELNKKA